MSRRCIARLVGLCMIFGCDIHTVKRCMRFKHEIKPRVVIRRIEGGTMTSTMGPQDSNKSTKGSNADEEHQLRSAICERNQTGMVVLEVPRGRQTSTNSGVPVNEIKRRR